MTGDLQIAPMSPQDLGIAVDWAAAEGWNPGLHDAEAFHRVDPDGFLMGWLNGTPVSAISVVRHSDRFGFLGFYLCLPDHRGKGYGMATWRAGMAHLGDRIVGLDGVPAQEANYMRSGFTLAHYTQRYAGSIRGAADPKCRRVTAADMPAILQMDLSISGTNRSAYISSWLSETPTRQTLVCETGGQVKAVGTIRSCRQGHKIGPLFAPDRETALALTTSLADVARADAVMIDVPDPNGPGVDLVTSLGLAPVFSCARMYRGAPLDRQIGRIFAETTFELG